MTIDKNTNLYLLFVSIGLFILANIFMPSYLNGYSTDSAIHFYELFDNANFKNILDERQSNPYFATRFITYSIVFSLNKFLGIPFQMAYTAIMVCSTVLLTWLIIQLCKIEKVDDKYILSLFFILFPVIFCLGSMIAGFDELLHWALTLLTFYLIKVKNYIGAIFSFFLAVLTREAIFFLIPVLVFPLYKENKWIWFLSYFIIAIAGFILISKSINVPNRTGDFYILNRPPELTYNLITYLARTIWIVYICVIFPLVLFETKDLAFKNANLHFIVYMNLFLLLTILYDEGRQAFYSVLLTVPYWAVGIKKWITYQKDFIKKHIYWQILIVLLSFVFSFYWYQPCSARSCIFYSIYSFIFIPITLPYVIHSFPELAKALKESFQLQSIKALYWVK